MSLTPLAPPRALVWPSSIDALRTLIPPQQEVYVVGGAVRDAYLGHPLHDIDLATPGNGQPLARSIANAFKGAYYPLDAERGVGRALIPWEGMQLTVDVAQFRGPDLLADLQKRDFTLNAMAVQLGGNLQAVIDPLGGLIDLEAKRLRQCGPNSIPDDPVRALRAVRTSVAYDLLIEPATRQAIKDHAARLAHATPERVRDEFFLILGGRHPAAALKTLARLGLLEQIIPETVLLEKTEQGPPHQLNVWHHTLVTLDRLDVILQVISGHPGDPLAANLPVGVIVSSLGELRACLQKHLAQEWPNGRSHRALIMLAAFLHDAGKPATRSIGDDGKIHFYDHERAGESLARQRAESLRLSKDEEERLAAIVRYHMRPHHLNPNTPPAPRTIYRFWRDAGVAGVDICLLALADYLGTYGVTLDSGDWIAYVNRLRVLLESYFFDYDSAVAPPPLITGKHLLHHFGLEPGPQIGRLLECIREAQIEGKISTYEEALEWVRRLLKKDA